MIPSIDDILAAVRAHTMTLQQAAGYIEQHMRDDELRVLFAAQALPSVLASDSRGYHAVARECWAIADTLISTKGAR